MSANSVLTLREIHSEDCESCHSLVVKHYPVKWREDDVQQFFKSVIKTEVKNVCIPEAQCDIAVAVLHEELVYDTQIQKWQEKAFRRPIDNCFPILELLGQPTGIYIEAVPEGISNDLLAMYFENVKSGGLEGTVVEPIEDGFIDNKKYTVITVNSPEAIKSILSKQTHELNRNVLKISPFYPSVHRYVLETMKTQGQKDEDMSEDDAETQLKDENNIIIYERQQIPIERNDSNKCDQDIDIVEKIECPSNSNQHEINDTVTSQTLCGSANEQTVCSDDRKKQATPIVGKVKPVMRVPTQHGHDTTFEEPPQSKKSSLMEEIVDMPSYKIELLIKCRFRETYESETLKILFKQEEEKVVFQAYSFEEFKSVRSKLYSSLDEICFQVLKPDASKYRLLSCTENMSWIRSKCEQKNVRVSFVTDDIRKEVICYSFDDSTADKGIKLVEDCIVSKAVPVRETQQNLLRGPNWLPFKKSVEDDMTSVYIAEDGKFICVDSLDEIKADEAKQKVDQYLTKTNQYLTKPNVNKKMADVQLESGRARCFQENVQERLRLQIEKKQGSLHVKVLSKDPLKIQVSCEGPEEVTSLLTNAVQVIWRERIDFSKLSSSAEETGLIMNSLNRQVGKNFISKFEQKHNCCIEISKDGEIVVQKPRVVVKDVFGSSDEEHGAEESDSLHSARGRNTPTGSDRVHSARGRDTPEGSDNLHSARGRGTRGQYNRERFNKYQSGMSESEAIQKAMELSMQSTSSTNEVQEPCEDSGSNRVFSHDETDSDGYEEDAIHDRPDTEGYRLENSKRRNDFAGTISISGTNIKLIKGAIAKQKADVLVNVVSTSQTPFEGVIAKSFLENGGPALAKMFTDSDGGADKDFVITRSSGRLQCSHVIHVKLTRSEDFEKIVRRVVSNVLIQCNQLGAKDIAFPPLGVGRMFRYQPCKVAQAMLEEMRVQLSTGRNSVKNVSVVIFDDETYQIFQKEFQDFNTRKHIHRRKPPAVGGCSRGISDNQRQNRKRSSRGREAYSASHHRGGARSKSSSSGNSQESSDRRKHSVDTKRGDEHGHVKQDNCSSKSTVQNLSVKIVAENKDMCITARKTFCSKLKEKYLYEETVEKKRKVSPSSKRKIVNIITAGDIICIKGKDNYKLKGLKANVLKVHSEILKVLLDERTPVEHRRKLKNNTKRETLEFVKVMTNDDEPEAPNYWKNYKEGETLVQSLKRFIGKKCEHVELDKGSRQFKCIVKMINETFDPQLVGKGNDAAGLETVCHNSLFVLKIERLENLCLYEQYIKRRQNLYRKLYESKEARFPKLEQIPNCSGPIATSKFVQHHLDGDLHPEINEYLLFHSTKTKRVPVICNAGFDSRLGSGESMFGQGIYGAERATKADQYADDKTNRTRGPLKMFLIRMLLGNGFICKENKNPFKYRRPPCIRCSRDDCLNTGHSKGKFGHFYDSVIGDNGKLFREFVVYENNLCYPEYLITYERR